MEMKKAGERQSYIEQQPGSGPEDPLRDSKGHRIGEHPSSRRTPDEVSIYFNY